MGIYEDIEKLIVSLSPMEDVTDSVFRQVILSLGRPDLFYTEFVNVEGLNSKGTEKVIHRLRYSKKEKPIIAQLWGISPKNFLKSSEMVHEMGFDGVDINMGCSVKNVVRNRAGSGLIIEDRGLVKEIIEATKEGAGNLPVSVKTRIGFSEVDIEGWIGFLLDQSLDALTVHMRTARGENAIHANWEYMQDIVELRNEKSPTTLLFGNGDIQSVKEGKEKAKKYGIDGVMIGRAAIANPWIFSEREDIPLEERLKVFKMHLTLFKNTWDGKKDFNSLKKFFRAYINGFQGANEIRQRFMNCSTYEEVIQLISEFMP